MNRAPSFRALLAAFPNLTTQNATLIRKAWRRGNRSEVKQLAEQHAPAVTQWVRACFHPPSTREIRRKIVDVLLETHGIEWLGIHRRTRANVYYCNSGDTYAATLIFHESNMYIGCWADLVEGNKIREVT